MPSVTGDELTLVRCRIYRDVFTTRFDRFSDALKTRLSSLTESVQENQGEISGMQSPWYFISFLIHTAFPIDSFPSFVPEPNKKPVTTIMWMIMLETVTICFVV